MKLLLICFLSFQISAKNYQQRLQEWNDLNEKKLLEEHQIIKSDWFDDGCIELSKQLEFNKITQCKLFDSNELNAFVLNNGHVYFSKGLMKQIKNSHQWASILAHENAHLELNHYIKRLKKFEKPGVFFPKTRLKKFMIRQEDEADSWAANYLNNMGFEESQIYYLLIRVDKINSSIKSEDHRKLKSRIKKLKKPEQLDLQLITQIESL